MFEGTEQVKILNVAIVGGGPACKAIMDMIFAEKLSQLRMKLIGVAHTDPDAVGYRYALEKGIYTTKNYRDLYSFEELNLIIELTGSDAVANKIFLTKPANVRLVDHVVARSFWYLSEIEEQRITDRKQAEERLQESEEKYRVLFETAKDAVFVTDETGRFLDVNQAACKSLGYSKEDLLKLSNKELDADPGGYEAFLKIRDGLVDKITFEVNQRRKDGTLLPVEITGSFFESGGRRMAVALVRDISQRKQAEEALRKSEEKYRSLYESSKCGIGFSDMQGNLLDANRAFLDMLGYSIEELRKLTYQELTPKKWHEMEADIVKNQIMSRGYSDEYEMEFIKKDGTGVPVTVRGWLIYDEQGKPIGMWGIARDITERKQAEDALKESERYSRGLIEANLDALVTISA